MTQKITLDTTSTKATASQRLNDNRYKIDETFLARSKALPSLLQSSNSPKKKRWLIWQIFAYNGWESLRSSSIVMDDILSRSVQRLALVPFFLKAASLDHQP